MQQLADRAALKKAIQETQNRKNGAEQRRNALEAIAACALYCDNEDGRLARLYFLKEHGAVIARHDRQ